MNARRPRKKKKRVFKPRQPRVDPALIDRLGAMIDAIGSNSAASIAIARSEGAVRKWLRAESEPAASDIRRLCETSGFSAEWILFGTDFQGRCQRENRILAGPARLVPLVTPENLDTPLGLPNFSGDIPLETRRAREILMGLVQGIDPLSLEELPKGTVLEKADVVRALLAGASSLELAVARQSRRSQLPRNIGRAWSDQENSRLIDAFHAGVPWKQIATDHGRTLRGIEARLEKQGLITAEQRTTTDRFSSKQNDRGNDE